MRQNFFIATVSLFSLLFIACQKENSADKSSGTPTSNSPVKTYTETITSSALGNSTTTYNLSYDNNGRIISMISASSPGNKFVFVYPANNKYSMDIYANASISIHQDFFLNADSFIDSSFQYNDEEDTSTQKYIYNASKQLLRIKEYEYSKSTGAVLHNTTQYSYDANGNITKTEDAYGDVHLYEYHTNLSYVQPLLQGPSTSAANKKVNLVKKHTLVSSGVTMASANLTYTFDDKDRISTEKAMLTDGTIITKTYTYF